MVRSIKKHPILSNAYAIKIRKTKVRFFAMGEFYREKERGSENGTDKEKETGMCRMASGA